MDKIVPASIFKTLTHPSFFAVALKNVFKIPNKKYTNLEHIDATMQWLCRSQDNSGGGGCSASFIFNNKWDLPYPETTGYIISTFLTYAQFRNDNSYIDRAIKMGDWEIDIQLPSGGVRGGVGINENPVVFNTGMVIIGWTDLYEYTQDRRYLNAAINAADWLCSVIDEDGRWTKYEYNNTTHAYHSRVSWSLLKVYKLTHNHKYKDTASKNLKWILSGVHANEWIDFMGFTADEVPFTHTIAYTIRGLLECSHYFDEGFKDSIQSLAINASEQILDRYLADKIGTNTPHNYLPGVLNSEWESDANFTCLTGNAQLAIIWLKIYKLNNKEKFLNGSIKMLDQLKETQSIDSRNLGVRGGIQGSYPIWGKYMRLSYPNWAAKFFADALILLETTRNNVGQVNMQKKANTYSNY